jgi:hypothetical protein
MFNFFKKSKKPENLDEIISKLEKIEKRVDQNNQAIQDLQSKLKLTIQKVGITRFNPFKETGGDQSFSVALLDQHNNGILLTSLYSKERNRIFAKPIEEGGSKYKLSEEEQRTINQAKEI